MPVDPEIAFSQGDLMRRVRQLEARVRELDAGRRLENASVGAGGIRVKGSGGITLQDGGGILVDDGADVNIRGGALNVYDQNGTLVAVVGLLPNGARGIAALDPTTDSLVELSTLAFGIRSVDAEDEEVLGTEEVWSTLPDGPTVTNVRIGNSGRALVQVSADVLSAPTGASGRVDAWMGFEISGASSRDPNVFDSLRVAHRRDADTTGNPSVVVGASRQVLVEGLSAGLHTVEARYRYSASSEFDEASFMSRNITVIPF